MITWTSSLEMVVNFRISRELLSFHTVGVLVESSLPGRVGMRKEKTEFAVMVDTLYPLHMMSRAIEHEELNYALSCWR